jgi:hypothetical protein
MRSLSRSRLGHRSFAAPEGRDRALTGGALQVRLDRSQSAPPSKEEARRGSGSPHPCSPRSAGSRYGPSAERAVCCESVARVGTDGRGPTDAPRARSPVQRSQRGYGPRSSGARASSGGRGLTAARGGRPNRDAGGHDAGALTRPGPPGVGKSQRELGRPPLDSRPKERRMCPVGESFLPMRRRFRRFPYFQPGPENKLVDNFPA